MTPDLNESQTGSVVKRASRKLEVVFNATARENLLNQEIYDGALSRQ